MPKPWVIPDSEHASRSARKDVNVMITDHDHAGGVVAETELAAGHLLGLG